MSAAAKVKGQLAKLRTLMDKSDKLHAAAKPVDDAIAALREKLLKEFSKAELSTTAAGLRVAVSTTPVPSIVDQMKFLAYATRKANWDLLQKTCASAAWRERMEAKKAVPGVESFNRVSLSVTRVGGKKK